MFRFSVPKENSHYKVRFCCVPGEGVFEQISAYHGEITVDPVDGSILGLSLKADLKPNDPLTRSDILVKYGPVEIGGKTYICPVKSISVTVAPEQAATMQRYRGLLLDQDRWAAREHLQTLMNDIAFDDYHVFRSEARVLTGGGNSKSGNSAPTDPERSIPTAASTAETKQPETSASEGTPAIASDHSNPAEASTVSASEAPTAPLVSPAPTSPEIIERKSTGLPDEPVTPPSAQSKDVRLRVTTRLVDVGVVAVDKKGRPVTDLKQEDFEIYDDGRKQELRFFSRPGTLDVIGTPSSPGASPGSPVYSNRRADIGNTKAGVGPRESGCTILLIDSANLTWADLTYAREQMLRFLQTLPPNERVGIYVHDALGFQVLMEATPDRAKLVSALRGWIPPARNLAAAQGEERRNRQQIEDVSHIEDLQSVNGNVNTNPDSTATVDSQLRDFGSNPGGNALATLVLVARHVAATPGHKNLVWVASENVLVNWTDQALSSDKGSKHIEGPVLHAQEALSDAKVSVYPLDASQLETQALDASFEHPNVVLSPSVTAPPPPQSGGAAPGRITAEMQQDLHPVQGPIREMAEATGGRVFRRGGDLAANLNSVLEDGHADYLLGFAPDVPADDQYHRLVIKLESRRGVVLRYRMGYIYRKEITTLKDRLREAVWQPLDVSDIAISARPLPALSGSAFKLNIAANDLALRLKDGRWQDKLDIFVVQRGADGFHARISERQLILALKPATYQNLMETGIPFEQFVEQNNEITSIRMIVVDEASGQMGAVTVPAAALKAKP